MYIDAAEAHKKGIFPCDVYCDGNRVSLCCGFDLEAGYADAFRLKPDGSYDVDKAKGEVKRDRYHGYITFKVKGADKEVKVGS